MLTDSGNGRKALKNFIFSHVFIFDLFIVGNFAPTISVPSSVVIIVGEEFTFSGSVNDSNGDVVTVTTDLPDAVVTRSEDDFTITATVTTITNFNFTIIAKVKTRCKENHL